MDPGKFSRRPRRETRFYRSVLALTWALGLCSSVGAQTVDAVSNLSGSESLEIFLAETATLRADFEQELWNSEGQLIERATGALSLKRPNRFLWNYREPFEQLVIADGESLWIYDVELEQATVTELDESVAATPAMLLSGDQSVRDGFDVLETFDADGIDWVRLAPKLEGTDFRSVAIGFSGGELASLELVDGLDQLTVIQFDQVDVNLELSDDSFDFSPPEDVDVIGQPGGSR